MPYRYTAVISSNSSCGQCIATNSSSAMAVAMSYGRAEMGETICVYRRLRSGEVRYLSCVTWDAESRRYIRVAI